ncbi:MAG: hemolysin family protein [Chloroflexota bacterium]
MTHMIWSDMDFLGDGLPILCLVLLNGLFSMAEAAVVSSRKARLQMLAEVGHHGARTALELANEPNRFLSTIQIGITLIGILTGAFGGATIAHDISDRLARFPLLAPYSEALGLGIVVAIITYLSLVIGELVPKRLALNAPERVAATLARPMHYLSLVAGPLVKILSFSTDLMLWLMRVRPSAEPSVSEAEITTMIAEGTESGVFEASEQDMVKRVFRLNDLRVSRLMTPRTEIVRLDIADSADEIRQKIAASGFSRYPVCDGSADKVLGVVGAKDLLVMLMAGTPVDLKAALSDPLFVPESMLAIAVLEEFKKTGAHMAVVIDEYGGLNGLFTINNILSAIVGDIPLSGKPNEPLAVQRENGSWLVDGMLSIVEFKDLLHLSALPEEESGTYQTLAGFVMLSLGKVPTAADHFEWNGLRFEVMDMDGNKIDKVLVAPLPTEAANQTASE